MENFYKREDRFNFFETFENPLLNLCFELEVDDFTPYCKKNGIPVSHFFLYALFMGLDQIDNFKYRIYEGKVIKIEKYFGSYTVIDENNLFNYTRFEIDSDLRTFVDRSLKARDEAMGSEALINTGAELPVREMKNYVFITSLPWLKFTSIEHPVFRFKSADIPAVAWGRFTKSNGKILVPFSVQAHHGFVDGYHMHLLGEKIKAVIAQLIALA